MPRLSPDEFARIVEQIMEAMPASIVEYLDNVVIDIQDRPSRRLLRQVGFTPEEIAAGESLYGLFMPMELPDDEEGGFVHQPHQILIFQEPLEADFPDPATLRMEIRRTVVHELAHHFGWSEADLESFEAKVDPWRSENPGSA